MHFLTFFKRFFSTDRTFADQDATSLRIAFKSRYHQFRLLLKANNNALEVMEEIERALNGADPFGMKFIRSRCTRVSTNVFQIIRHIDELAPEKYGKLYERFKEIQQQLNPFVHPKIAHRTGPLILDFKEIDRKDADQVGPKMANLCELVNRMGVRSTPGFSVTAAGFTLFITENDLQSEIDRRIQAADAHKMDALYALSAELQQLIIRSPVPEPLAVGILNHFDRIQRQAGHSIRAAMRSSALGEDLAGASFAGQYRSILNVSRENLVRSYKEIVASKYAPQAMAYRFNRGIRDEEVAMCIGCMQMVNAMSGGVIYTRNPIQIRNDDILVHAAWGLPKSVVDGSVAADLFIVARNPKFRIKERLIAKKDRKYVCDPEEGICRMAVVPENEDSPSISDEKVLQLAELAVRIESHYQTPQDIEWAVDENGETFLLQSRRLKQIINAEESKIEIPAPVANGPPMLYRGKVTASPGAAIGPAFIVRKDMDALRFPKGAVLVADRALPKWASLLDHAAAVVTEYGTVAGHLATVAREFGVPALFGVENAVALTPQGQEVTVDADGLTVYSGRFDAILKDTLKPSNPMKDSTVYRCLEAASRLILPLNLMDPDSPKFKAEFCRSFHDITRFCHERAVDEMFRFGRDHQFPERSSKQLHSEIPMQWWILNLDNGFENEVDSKYVEIENISSVPMRALWEGISAFPWGGPPPVDGKGFMSVMFQATANTALVPSVKSSYANRNYFMISRHFCNLQSRLGFHFSTVEAIVGDRTGENYVNFFFKGGAADYGRRIRRVIFVKEILESHGFDVDIKEDALRARVEQRETEFMTRCLKILGYLTIHTRQLDMIMANPSSVAYYRSKIEKDITMLIGD